MKKAIAIGLAVAACVALNVRAEDAKKFDADKLVGKWKYTSGLKGGTESAKEMLAGEVVITKDTFTLPAGEQKFTVGYKLDSTGTPAKIDLDIKDGPFKDSKAEGIISLDGDEVKICYVPAGMGDRPTKFESTEKNKAFLFVLKRVK